MNELRLTQPRYVVMDAGQHMLYGNSGQRRSFGECEAFAVLWDELRAAADDGALRPVMVYRWDGDRLVPVSAAPRG